MRRFVPRWRKMTWVLLIWTAIFAIWIITGVNNNASHSHAYCVAHQSPYVSIHDCETAAGAGTAIGLTVVFLLWFIGFLVLALVWIMSRPRRRSCPACGQDVKKGKTTCPNCGYSFIDAAANAPQATGTAMPAAAAIPATSPIPPEEADAVAQAGNSAVPPPPATVSTEPGPPVQEHAPVTVETPTPGAASTATASSGLARWCTTCGAEFMEGDGVRFCTGCGAPRHELPEA